MWSRIAWWSQRRAPQPSGSRTGGRLAQRSEAEQRIVCDGQRRRLVEEILTVAPGAREALLVRFDVAALTLFRDHLLAASLPRGPESRWERPGDTPAVLMREPMD